MRRLDLTDGPIVVVNWTEVSRLDAADVERLLAHEVTLRTSTTVERALLSRLGFAYGIAEQGTFFRWTGTDPLFHDRVERVRRDFSD